MNSPQRAILETIKSQFHDWAVKEPNCHLAYVTVDHGAPPELLNGPPIGEFLREDRHVIHTHSGWSDDETYRYKEHAIFIGSHDASDAFSQLSIQLNDLLFYVVPSTWKARHWIDYLWESASKAGGFGSVTIQPSTWTGNQVQFFTREDPRPTHVFGILAISPLLASELAVASLLESATSTDELQDRPPLSEVAASAYEILLELPEYRGMKGPALIEALKKRSCFVSQSVLTSRVIPELKPYGVMSTKGKGYSIPASARPQKMKS